MNNVPNTSDLEEMYDRSMPQPFVDAYRYLVSGESAPCTACGGYTTAREHKTEIPVHTRCYETLLTQKGNEESLHPFLFHQWDMEKNPVCRQHDEPCRELRTFDMPHRVKDCESLRVEAGWGKDLLRFLPAAAADNLGYFATGGRKHDEDDIIDVVPPTDFPQPE